MVALQKWALVTGANRGLGFEAAKKLAAKGHSVAITARDAEAGAKAAAAVFEGATAGAKVEALVLDAASPDSVRALVAEVAARFSGQIDLLINNAGIFLSGWEEAPYRATQRVNLDGAIDITLGLLPHLADGARVVMVASGLGKLCMLTDDYAAPIKAAATLDELRAAAHGFKKDSPLPGHNAMSPSYSVSKAALIRAAQILADSPDFEARRVSVVSVCPGWCATDMGSSAADKFGTKPPRTAGQGADSILQAAEASIPNGSLSRDGEVEDWAAPQELPAGVQEAAAAAAATASAK